MAFAIYDTARKDFVNDGRRFHIKLFDTSEEAQKHMETLPIHSFWPGEYRIYENKDLDSKGNRINND